MLWKKARVNSRMWAGVYLISGSAVLDDILRKKSLIAMNRKEHGYIRGSRAELGNFRYLRSSCYFPTLDRCDNDDFPRCLSRFVRVICK